MENSVTFRELFEEMERSGHADHVVRFRIDYGAPFDIDAELFPFKLEVDRDFAIGEVLVIDCNLLGTGRSLR